MALRLEDVSTLELGSTARFCEWEWTPEPELGYQTFEQGLAGETIEGGS